MLLKLLCCKNMYKTYLINLVSKTYKESNQTKTNQGKVNVVVCVKLSKVSYILKFFQSLYTFF